MTLRRLLPLVYILLLTACGLWAGTLFVEARAEYEAQKRTLAANEARLAVAKGRLDEQQRIMERLKTDPQFVERMIRVRLGYARPTGEIIFRLED